MISLSLMADPVFNYEEGLAAGLDGRPDRYPGTSIANLKGECTWRLKHPFSSIMK